MQKGKINKINVARSNGSTGSSGRYLITTWQTLIPRASGRLLYRVRTIRNERCTFLLNDAHPDVYFIGSGRSATSGARLLKWCASGQWLMPVRTICLKWRASGQLEMAVRTGTDLKGAVRPFPSLSTVSFTISSRFFTQKLWYLEIQPFNFRFTFDNVILEARSTFWQNVLW
jgi:hypothetical protein